jgi:tetratricopeptide (TPR) repeat protein
LGNFLKYSVLLIIGLTASCSTEKNKWLNRGYHRMTARYNGYFNANEKIKESLNNFRSSYKEDYTKILPVYIYADQESASSLNSDMDKAIEKTSRVIKRHSMPSGEKNIQKKEEWNKWIDDNWLLMGQAYFYKRSFEDALARFEYCYNAYKTTTIYYDAQLWMARTHMETGNMIEAQRWLDKLENKQQEAENQEKEKDKKTTQNKAKGSKSKKNPYSSKSKKTNNKKAETPPFPAYLKADLAATYADYYIRKNDYDRAIEQLQKAIKATGKKKTKARYTFILAQLLQEKGRAQEAMDTYAQVLKLSPTFEMEFYSRINRALLYSGGDSKELRAELFKLLKDAKNKEYFDQIYYALAEIEFKHPDKEKGISYLQKSIEASISNNKQKGKTYLRLGEVYFQDRLYVQAKNYYDSALALLPADWPKYDKIKEKSIGLTDLVQHLETIRIQDSLLKLASMSNKDLESYIANVLKKQKEEEQRKKEEQAAKEIYEQNKPANINTMAEGSGWYFYNQQLLGKGFNDFKKIWGPRKLEDDWRRKDKTSVSDEFLTNNNPEVINKDPLEVTEQEIEAAMKDIPRGPEALATANEKIMQALYKSGVIFKDNLAQYDLAAKQFKELAKRYPDSEQTLPGYYQLYMLYAKTNNPEKETYKNIILTDYPLSEYAKIIKDPNYRKNEEIVKAEQEKKYTDAYKKYNNQNWQDVLLACNEVIEKEKEVENFFLPRYYFLRALTYGKLNNREKLKESLAETAQKFPKDEIGKQAADLLEYFKEQESKENAAAGKKLYVYDPNAEHFFIYLFPNNKGSINNAKNSITDFNMHYFSLKEFTVTNNFLDTDNQLIIVKNFENKQKAMEYYIAFKNDNLKLGGLNKDAEYYVITAANYASFYLEKKPEDYKKFFEENYK